MYAQFDPGHDSRVEDKNTYQFGIHGYPANRPEQPVVRVSWDEAMAFCRWLSEKTGERFTLPTEAQWEYACRAGTATPFFFGDLDADFSKFANLADAKLSEFASNPVHGRSAAGEPDQVRRLDSQGQPVQRRGAADRRAGPVPAQRLGPVRHARQRGRVDADHLPAVSVPRGRRPRQRRQQGRKVVRGGSWRDEPKRATSSFRLSYLPWQRVYNVGFRVVCEQGAALARR